MTKASNHWLVETDWLAQRLSAPDLVVLDATLHLPSVNRDAHQEYFDEHIPGALFFDIDEIADTHSPLPHMLPSPEKFSSRMRNMGIGDGMRIVTYDTKGMFSAARAWWMFRVMGVSDVAVLNGGLPKWKSENHLLEDAPPLRRSERHFTARYNMDLVRECTDVETIVKTSTAQLIDARSPKRFAGHAPEPREGMRAGHMPGAFNIHYEVLLNLDGTVKSEQQLRAIFETAGVDLTHPVVTTCGSGVTAGIVALALAILGNKRTAVYDGSWSEWGADASLPIETGP